jgi:hypothetical protein
VISECFETTRVLVGPGRLALKGWLAAPVRVRHTDKVGTADRVQRPFWLHQAAEYVVGLALIAQGLQAAEPWLPGAAGAVIVVNAAIARGPLGAFAFVGRRLHRLFDVIIIVGLLGAAILPGVELAMRLVLGGFAVVLGFVARYTRYDHRAAGSAGASPGRRRTDASDGETSGDRAEDFGRRAGRLAGEGVKAWRSRR